MFVQHFNLRYHFEQFHLLYINKKQNLVWKGLRVAMIWDIWNHRNRVTFKQWRMDVEEDFYIAQLMDVEEDFYIAQLKNWLWLKSKNILLIFPTPIGY